MGQLQTNPANEKEGGTVGKKRQTEDTVWKKGQCVLVRWRQKNAKPTLTSKTNNGWRLFTLKSQQLSLRQKKLLFQAHNLYKIKERNSALIFQPQCHLHTISYKDKNTTITTSTTSSSNQTPASLQEDIATLNSHYSHLQLRIKAITQSQLTYHSKHTSFPKSSNQLNEGHQLHQQLNKINIAHRLFLYLFQTRSTFSSWNTTHIMEQNLRPQRATFTESEKIKLSSSNKVHKFTSISLPPDAISLINKGTNFIPTTTTTPGIASLQKKLSNLKSTQPSVHLSARKTTLPSSNHPTLPNHFFVSILTASRRIFFLYYIKNNHGLTSTFTSLTMFTILFLSLENFCNLLNSVLLFILNYVTPTYTPHLTLQTYRTTMT